MKTDFDTVILLQTDFSEIPNATAANINELMWTGDVRTFLIIARDSDCSIDYWKQVSEMPDLSAENTTAAAESLKQALFEFRKDSDRTIELKSDSFFGLAASNREDPPFEIPVKAESVDPPEIIQARWRLNRRLIKRGDAEVLWSSGDDQLLTSQPLGNGRRILVLSSAAPILNGGLVNSGNRRLAEELLKELPPGPVAISLSSRWSDEKHISSPSSLRFLKVHPHGWIFGQAMLALLMFCWWKLPIFGRPRVNVDTEDQRFGRHVEALGKLLQRTGDSTFARLAIRDWQRTGPIRAAGQSTVDGDSLNNDSDSEMSIEEEEE